MLAAIREDRIHAQSELSKENYSVEDDFNGPVI